MKKRVLILGILVILGLALSMLLTTGGSAKQTVSPDTKTGPELKHSLPQPGDSAPDFVLADMEGRSLKLSDLRGKKVLINFWATWCQPCHDEMPELVQKYEEYKDKIAFYGINLTNMEGGNLSEMRNFLQQYHVSYPVLLDKEGRVANQYKIIGIPTTLTIDANGIIVDRFTGSLTETNMEGMIQNLLKR
jgi:cytochrome c biogenesis protein CcmG/thiol:disulfide interchange protein DsbE